MLKGFKDFILRGNVIELAVAVIIGAAFTAIVTSITDHLIQPLINSFGSPDFGGLGFAITDNPETFLDFGAVITAIINFLIVAAVIYFVVVLPYSKFRAAKEDAIKEEVELLKEIRDLLGNK